MTFTNLPRITVLMSVYNDERYLKESIESILNQTFKDFEFIIINDGSTDRTGQILKDYQERDPRIIIIEHQNMGLTKSLNKGIEKAKGKYIARQDADDVSLPSRLQEQILFLENHLEYCSIGTQLNFIDEKGELLYKSNFPVTDEMIKKAFWKRCPFHHSASMFRKDSFDKVGGYREFFRYSQDYDLNFRFSEIGKLANLNNYLCNRRLLLEKSSAEKMFYQEKYTKILQQLALERKEKGYDRLMEGKEIIFQPKCSRFHESWLYMHYKYSLLFKRILFKKVFVKCNKTLVDKRIRIEKRKKRWFPLYRPSHEIYFELSQGRLFPRALVLHLGAGRDSHRIASRLNGIKMISLDISEKMLSENKNHLRVAGDGEALPFKEQTFDFIMSENVFEHFKKPEAIFRECYRCLKPGGGIGFLTPNRHSYISIIGMFTPYRLRVRFKKFTGMTSDANDSFPTFYKCNTIAAISQLAKKYGLKVEVMKTFVDWPTYFEFSNFLHLSMTLVHKLLERLPDTFHITIVGILRKSNK